MSAMPKWNDQLQFTADNPDTGWSDVFPILPSIVIGNPESSIVKELDNLLTNIGDFCQKL